MPNIAIELTQKQAEMLGIVYCECGHPPNNHFNHSEKRSCAHCKCKKYIQTIILPNSNEVRFAHDCDKCIFLGNSDKSADKKVDVYWCKNPNYSDLDSIIGRYGDIGYEYASSHPPEAFDAPTLFLDTTESWYKFAIQKARSRGLYTGKYF